MLAHQATIVQGRFMGRRKLNIFIAALIALGLFSASTATSDTSSKLILDDFKEASATEISLHEPDIDVVGGGWSVALGTWEVKKGKAQELSTVPMLESPDYQAIIDAGTSDTSAQLKVDIDKKGDQFWGVVSRYSGTRDWIMAFHDGVGDLILGKKRPNEDQFGNTVKLSDPTAGGFQELGRVSLEWKKKSHEITLITKGDKIVVKGDGKKLITARDDDGMTSTVVGIFSRGTGKNKFKKFLVTQK